jgi:tetratricopeptide (TPR) repeat protein
MTKKFFSAFLLSLFLISAAPARLKSEAVNPHQFLQEAYQLIEKQEFDKALVILNRVIGMNFKSAPAYFNRGIRIDSKFAPAYMAKARVYFAQEKLSEAISELDKAVKADKKFGLAYYNRALVREKSGDFEKAFQDFKQARLYGVDVMDEEFQRVWTLGHLDEIILESEETIRKNPEMGEAYYSLGIAYYHKKDYGRSLENFKKAKQLGVGVEAELLKELEASKKS